MMNLKGIMPKEIIPIRKKNNVRNAEVTLITPNDYYDNYLTYAQLALLTDVYGVNLLDIEDPDDLDDCFDIVGHIPNNKSDQLSIGINKFNNSKHTQQSFIVGVQGNHFVALNLKRDKDNKLTFQYANSLIGYDTYDESIKKICNASGITEKNFRSKLQGKYAKDKNNCGIYALLALQAMRKGYNTVDTKGNTIVDIRKQLLAREQELKTKHFIDKDNYYDVTTLEYTAPLYQIFNDKGYQEVNRFTLTQELQNNNGNHRDKALQDNAYVDLNYKIEEQDEEDYKLEHTIDGHTGIITDGLISAARQTWDKGDNKLTDAALFEKIKEAHNIAIDGNGFKGKTAEDYQVGEEEFKQMKQFSALFQKKMLEKDLMTGNLKATNCVALRLKRVNPYHINAAEIALVPEINKQKQSQLDIKNIDYNQKERGQIRQQNSIIPNTKGPQMVSQDLPPPFIMEEFMKQHNQNYEAALKEIKAGKKEGHWMWYIFPQISGTGGATNDKDIPDLKTAKELLNDETFANHYLEIFNAVDSQCRKPENGYTMKYLEKLFDNKVDAKKFVSSITLFDKALQGMDCQIDTRANSNIYDAHMAIQELTEKFFKKGIEQCDSTKQKIQKEQPKHSK